MRIKCLAALFLILFAAVSADAGYAIAATRTKGDQVLDLQFLRMLKDRQIETLDRSLNELQLHYERDTEKEISVSEALSVIAIPDPELEDNFKAWVSSYPSSYAANLSVGAYYFAMALEWRGHKFINKTPQWKLEKMSEYLGKAYPFLKKALTLTTKPTMAYTLLIRAERLDGNSDEINKLLSEAIKHDPYCVLPRNAYMVYLEPRWGGSYESMQRFADEVGKGQHPKLKKAAAKYQGWIEWYKGTEKRWDDDYVGALKSFNDALAKAEDAKFLVDRAWIYDRVGQTDLALADIKKSLELSPYNQDAIFLRGKILLSNRRVEEGIQDLITLSELRNDYAMKELGFIYTNGVHGVPVNTAEGIMWFSRAAYFGDAYASFQLGGLYYRGIGVPVDMKLAADHLKIAVSLDDEKAMNELGLMYWYGRGVQVDHEAAIDLWIKASERGVWQAKHNLKFFLTPKERVMLGVRHPRLFFSDPMMMWIPIAAIGFFFLIVIMLVVLLVQLQSRKN